jgi:hypothetical protein
LIANPDVVSGLRSTTLSGSRPAVNLQHQTGCLPAAAQRLSSTDGWSALLLVGLVLYSALRTLKRRTHLLDVEGR